MRQTADYFIAFSRLTAARCGRGNRRTRNGSKDSSWNRSLCLSADGGGSSVLEGASCTCPPSTGLFSFFVLCPQFTVSHAGQSGNALPVGDFRCRFSSRPVTGGRWLRSIAVAENCPWLRISFASADAVS